MFKSSCTSVQSAIFNLQDRVCRKERGHVPIIFRKQVLKRALDLAAAGLSSIDRFNINIFECDE